jgi:tripartite motif-containing protein 2/3
MSDIDQLDDDYISINMLDMIAIERMNIECTSCKTEEKAVARCADCALFLCPNCVSAHKYMRCFDKHHVVALDEIISNYKSNNMKLSKTKDECKLNALNGEDLGIVGNGVPIHKPVYCKTHPREQIKIYCNTCQVIK